LEPLRAEINFRIQVLPRGARAFEPEKSGFRPFCRAQFKWERVMSFKFLRVVVFVLIVSISALADGGKLEQIGVFSGEGASESVKGALEEKGYRVVLDDGTPFCDLWLRKAVPTSARTDVPGAIYTEFAESTVLGVISFPKPTTDFRGQAIKAGSYTMRYSLHPTDGNHLGISPYRDFIILVPIGSDPDVNAMIKFQDLMKLSAKTSGSNHPAPLSLVAAEGVNNVPAITQNDHGHAVFAAKLKTASGAELPIAFVVKGIAEQ
jgi:hypothetical protein